MNLLFKFLVFYFAMSLVNAIATENFSAKAKNLFEQKGEFIAAYSAEPIQEPEPLRDDVKESSSPATEPESTEEATPSDEELDAMLGPVDEEAVSSILEENDIDQADDISMDELENMEDPEPIAAISSEEPSDDDESDIEPEDIPDPEPIAMSSFDSEPEEEEKKGGGLIKIIIWLLIIFVIIGGVFWFIYPFLTIGMGNEKEYDASIAILYMENISPDEKSYFADGLTEELITRLSRIQNLKVRPRTDVAIFKNKTATMEEISEKLSVNYIVEGAVKIIGDNLRVNVTLFDIAKNKEIWK